jgi:hypothetical protein
MAMNGSSRFCPENRRKSFLHDGRAKISGKYFSTPASLIASCVSPQVCCVAIGKRFARYDSCNMALTYSDGRKRAALFGLALLVASMTLLLARPACAAENQATIAAVEALLSLPQTQPPEGGWEHRAPPGFVVDEEARRRTRCWLLG